MGLTQLNFDDRDKVETAIELLRAWEPSEGYYGAFSGGKDSIVIKKVAKVASVKVDWHYCVSPIDPPEIYHFIRDYHPDVQWDYYAKNFWKTVVEKGLPTRRSRWCCEIIKEAGGIGRTIIVGSRRQEGGGRSKQRCYGQHTKKDSFMVRPINDWDSEEVWEYIHTNNLEYCNLYDEGFERLGCVLCPLANWRNRLVELDRFPKIANLWRRACDQIVEDRMSRGNISKRGKPYKQQFTTGQELWGWWINWK